MPLLSPEEVGSRLKLTPRTVREMVRTGRLAGLYLGRLIRLREEDIQAIERHGLRSTGTPGGDRHGGQGPCAS